nr:hypothetical protein [Angustibacter aerolatus]
MGLRDLLGRRRPDETTTGVRSAAKKIAAKTIGAPGRTRHQEPAHRPDQHLPRLRRGILRRQPAPPRRGGPQRRRGLRAGSPRSCDAAPQRATRTRPGRVPPPTPSGRSPRSLAHSSQAWYPLIRLAGCRSTTTRTPRCAGSRPPPSASRRVARSPRASRCCAARARPISPSRSASGTGARASTSPRPAARSCRPRWPPAGSATPAARLDVLLEFHDEQEVTDLTQHLDEVAPRRP